MVYLEIDALIQGIVYCEPAVKQDLGRRFAAYLGLQPGKAGADGGIDGEGEINGQRVYFQSKLSKNLLDASLVAEFWGYLTKYEADIGVMLAGIGYTSGFQLRLEEFPNINRLKIHLLTLEDIFAETPKFEQAVIDLPPLQDLSSGKWASLR